MEGRRRKTTDTVPNLQQTAYRKNEGGTGKVPAAEASEFGNICLLLLLYVLQGIPLGLSASIPMILQNRNISYKEQATFSLALWPFSVKLLWAPLVDSCYWVTMGRRKSWLVPAQYLIGVFMLVLSFNLDSLLGEEGSSDVKPNVLLLTAIFFALNFLAATQDIAVDGWALTMLSRKNVGYASTCNSVGQTAGFFLGYVVLLALESADFCINYLGQSGPLLQLDGYFLFWGIVFLVTTTLVWALKKEDAEDIHADDKLSLAATYKMLGTILKKTCIRRCVVVLLTCKIAFAAADALTGLKLTEAGVPKDKLALLSVPLTPVQVLLPFIISRYTAGPKPMDVFINAIPYRMFFSLVFAGVVYVTPWFQDSNGEYPAHYYALLVVVYVLHQITTNCMFVAVMAFFANISDPSVGGTYMTLLNTFTNLGGNWPTWVALRYVSDITWSYCSSTGAPCDTGPLQQACSKEDGKCNVVWDGYYIESAVCFVLGVVWYHYGTRVVRQLQSLKEHEWLVMPKRRNKTADVKKKEK
uniref:Acetyl-coenzyme A transporter 1-like n=2 Tax=Hirondellea gigas TaxID=1518452 RepID=A0A6A7G8I2_9CRUS